MRAFVKFTVLRVGLFAASALLLYALQVRGLLLILLAAVFSLALSYVLLRGPRQELAEQLADRASRRAARGQTLQQRLADDAAAEDSEALPPDRPEPPGGSTAPGR